MSIFGLHRNALPDDTGTGGWTNRNTQEALNVSASFIILFKI